MHYNIKIQVPHEFKNQRAISKNTSKTKFAMKIATGDTIKV